MPDWAARIIRTFIQLVAAGGLSWLTDQLAKDLPPQYVPYMFGVYMLLVTFAQNFVEQSTGKSLLKPANAQEERV